MKREDVKRGSSAYCVLRKGASAGALGLGWGVGIVLLAISGVAGWARAVALGRGFYGPKAWPGRGLGRWVKNKMAGTAER